MNKQQQTVLNMAGFIKSQSLTLLEKLDALDADEQAAMLSCTNSRKNSRTAYRHALKRKIAPGHNGVSGTRQDAERYTCA